MTSLAILIILCLLFFGMFVVCWRIRYESIRTRKALENILEKLTPTNINIGPVTKKSLEHYQRFHGDR